MSAILLLIIKMWIIYLCVFSPKNFDVLFRVNISIKQKQTTDHCLFTTMYGIPQNSHLGAAVWWEERKLRKSCIRSGDEEPVFVLTVRRSRVQEASIKPSWYKTHTVTRAHLSGLWHARCWIGTHLHYAFGLQAAGMDASVMVGRGTGGAAVFILIVFIVLLGARSSRAQKGTWTSEGG